MTNIFETIKEALEVGTLAEGDTFKKELTEYLKERRKNEKAENKDAKKEGEAERAIIGREVAVVGATVEFAYGKGTASGRVTKTSENTFTVILIDENGAEIELDSGKPKKIWRYYHQVVVADSADSDSDSE